MNGQQGATTQQQQFQEMMVAQMRGAAAAAMQQARRRWWRINARPHPQQAAAPTIATRIKNISTDKNHKL